MYLPASAETFEFFCTDEPYEVMAESVDLLDVADNIAIEIEVAGQDEEGYPEYEIVLHPIVQFKSAYRLQEGEYDQCYEDGDGEMVYIDFLDSFKIGNIASFFLTLEHIVETY